MFSDYYPYTCFFGVAMAIIALVMVKDNPVLPLRIKRLFALSFSITIVVSACEAVSLLLAGRGDLRPLTCVLIGFEYALTPAPSLLLAGILGASVEELYKTHVGVAIHGILELALCMSGIIFVVNDQGYFEMGPLYPVFSVVCVASVLYLLVKAVRFSNKAQVRNRHVPALILGMLGCVYVAQSLNSNVYLIWPVFSACGVFFYLLYCSVIQQTDALTRLLNRQSYEGHLTTLSVPAQIVFFDLDDFKGVNDTYGHEVGDQCLICVSRAIYEVYGKYGSVYRIGGDEFCAIALHGIDNIETLQTELCQKLDALRAEDKPWITYVSVGNARFNPGEDPAAAVSEADAMMYRFKRARKARRAAQAAAAAEGADLELPTKDAELGHAAEQTR